jgi:TetR/AcrR family transcriptional regulator, tetracycline repressor protein
VKARSQDGGRSGLDRVAIVATAITLLDDVGLDGLTMRRLAAELGVQNPALYWHFRNKQQLLVEMSDAIQFSDEHAPPRDGETWQDWLTGRARQRRKLLLAHRDGARLVASTRAGITILRRFDEELTAMTARGFEPLAAVRAITTVSHYITGFVLEEQAERQRHTQTPLDEAGEAELAGLTALGSHSPLTAAIREGGDLHGDAAFDDGLRILVAGIAATIDPTGATCPTAAPQ